MRLPAGDHRRIMNESLLIGDVGGSNARFALADIEGCGYFIE
jgi:glucokinase